MYRKHFGLARHPFANDLAPEDLFASAAATELEVRLRHLLDLRGIGLVTGEPGSGKTTICRKVAASLHSGLYRVVYVPLSTGNVTDMYKSMQCSVNPRDVFRVAVREAAHGIVFVHNHPSGDPAPSPDDADLTERLRAAAELVGVLARDHVIVAAGGYYSFVEAGCWRR